MPSTATNNATTATTVNTINTTATTRLSHRHQPSNLSFSSASSSSSSTRPALPQILSNSASNAVNFTRSTTPTSRRVRSHWFTHFVLNWRRSSRSSKLLLGLSMTLVGIQVIAAIGVLFVSWEMYCDKPLRIFVSVYIVRLVLTTPITIYLHLAPRRRLPSSATGVAAASSAAATNVNNNSSPHTSAAAAVARAELSEAYAMSERNTTNHHNNNRPLSFPPPITTNQHHRQQYHTAFITSNSTQQQQQHHQAANTMLHRSNSSTSNLIYHPYMDETLLKAWIDRAKSALDLFAVLWFIIGNYMLFSSTTCSDTAQPLYYFSLVLIVYGYLILSVPIFLCTSVIFCLPCVLVGMRLLHVDDGVYMGGATPEEISMIPVYQFKSTNNTAANTLSNSNKPAILKVVTEVDDTPPTDSITIDLSKSEHLQKKQHQLKPGLFDKLWFYLGLIDSPATTTEQPDYQILEIPDIQDQVCVICLSTYEDGDILCKLWCKHHFHKACVHEWLALNFRCPMCKQDSRGKDVMIDV